MKKRPEFQILLWLGIFIGFFLVAAAFIQYFESLHSESSIRSYGQALWYTLVTISTVGYGDYYPVSAQGKVVGSLVIIFSLGFAGFLIGKIQTSVAENIRRRNLGMKGCDFSNHYAVFGWNPKSRIVVLELLKAGKHVALLAETELQLTEIDNAFHKQRNMVFKTFGPFESEEMYERLQLEKAASIILVCDDDTATLITSLNLRKLYPNAQIIAHIANPMLKETISSAGVTYVVSSNEIVGRMIASAAFEPDVSRVLEDLLSGTDSEDEFDIQQYLIRTDSLVCGKTIAETEKILNDANAGRVLAISMKQVDMQRRIEKNPNSDQIVNAEDYLITIVNGQQASRLRKLLGGISQGI
jgi:voltage-gated potassium channel